MKKHKFVASECYAHTSKENGKLIKNITFKVHQNHMYYIDKMMSDVEGELEVTFKTNKESRSIKQNNLLWKLISLISDTVNGSHTDNELDHLYRLFIKEANIAFDYVATTEEIAEKLKEHYRVVYCTGDVYLQNGKQIKSYKLYRGSSQFDTKEMSDFIDVVLRHASELGIDTMETTELRNL